MGGIGVDRYEIENIATKRKIPLDAVVIKVSDEEALMPMKKEIFKSVDASVDSIKESVKRSRKNEKILIMGVGNTCGVGNNTKTVKEVEKKVKRQARLQKDSCEKKKRFGF